MKAKSPTNATPNAVSTESIAQDIYRLALQQTLQEMKDLKSGRSKPRGEYTITEAISYLAKQATSFAAEDRKAEQVKNRGLDKLTRTQVMAWVRTKLDPPGREALVREIQRIDAEESVLT